MTDNAQMRESAQEEQKPAAKQSDDELERLRSRVAELESRLTEAEDTNKALRVRLGSELERANELVADLQAGRGFLLSERASREKQEPVGHFAQRLGRFVQLDADCWPKGHEHSIPLYAAQTVTAPVRLTDEDVSALYDEAGFDPQEMREAAEYFARAIEAAVLTKNGLEAAE